MKKDDLIIIRVDGGICSQLNFYAVGAYLMAKKYHVKFDLDWFRTDGKDMDGVFARNFDLLTAFPNLPFEEASLQEISYYARKHPKKTNKLREFKPPLYVNGYPNGGKYLRGNREFFIDCFTPPQIGFRGGQQSFNRHLAL